MELDKQTREAAGAILRRGAEMVLATLDETVARIHERHLGSPGMEEIADDPVLAAASQRAIRATIAHWAAAVVAHPWAPVAAADDANSLRMARDLVRRGLSDSINVAYRVGQVEAWRAWVDFATRATDDPELLRIVLDHAADSIARSIEQTLTVVREVIEAERAELRRGDAPLRRETIELLLDGAPISVERASRRIGLDLTAPHTACVVWTSADDSDQLAIEEAIDLLVRQSATRRPVVTFPSTGIAWVWLSGPAPDLRSIERDAVAWPTLRIAIGETSVGTEGFRASHRSAIAVQRLISRSGRHVARAEDTRLTSLLARHGDEALDFARSTLGRLTEAPDEILLTVRTYLDELGSLTHTAERLFAHRNTIVRRLERADALLPRPLAERPMDVAAALDLWSWVGAAQRTS